MKRKRYAGHSALLPRRAAKFDIQPNDFDLNIFLRKEVIQPQVPLRLPCYDFTPVAEPTLAGCLPEGLAHRLRVNPTPMV